ncbi:hypothetical protein F8S09_15305 [Deinococcus sp. SDU3-2]|uniref:Phosphatase PAP2 family protein n=1 Tax=Deinococcus terrestris TaxID=2651870 RepID=A0A7X1NY97_9DEIO|nr:hypothetical protein [Deinococcus terrestris]MPY68025.1 hypothetical protein [Deinococcus terrestris]
MGSALTLLRWHTRWRLPGMVLGVLYVLGTIGSRVYIGVYSPTDVFAGMLFSVTWVLSLAWGVQLRRERSATDGWPTQEEARTARAARLSPLRIFSRRSCR